MCWKNRLHPAGNLLAVPRQTQKTQQTRTRYLWDGNRQLQEQTDTHVFTTVYEQDSFEPVARLVWLKDELSKSANDEPINNERLFDDDKPQSSIQVYHYHNDHLGTPNELTNQDGEVIWLADYEAWGNMAKIIWREEKLESLQVSADELQPIRFQGQSFDEETGLHYNRFRYFDPDLGMFTTRDPIGLMGGNNVFQYAPKPVGWIDPFGLAKLFEIGTYGGLNGGDHVGDNLQAHELIRHEALVQDGRTSKTSRMTNNPSIALDLDHHTRGPSKDSRGIGGAHYHETQIRQEHFGLGKNDIHPNMKIEMDITQGALRKAGVPKKIVKELRKAAERFYKQLSGCTT